METLRSNVNNLSNYPSKETMELFLELGKRTGMLSKGIEGYKNINAVITLAVVCDYLCQAGKETEKKAFLEELGKKGDQYYKMMGELALNIWEQKLGITSFSKSMIKSNREKLEIPNRTYPYFPVIVKDDFNNRIKNIDYKRMIHEEFEAELARLKGVSEGADQIQAKSRDHQFYRGDNSEQINDLERKL